jgi:hypothetical protein
MPAPGGPTTQSGIGFQDAVAALYLGRLCDGTARTAAEVVRAVRVETRGPVDDIEVVHGDGSRRWIQAKERVATSSEEWKNLWRAFREKRETLDVSRGDRLVLWLGSASKPQEALAEAAKRGWHARDAAEWWSDLSQDHRTAVEGIEDVLGMAGDRQASLELLRIVDIEVVARERLRDRIPYWMPPSRSTSQDALYEVLQAKALDGARYRRTFARAELLRDLRAIGIDVLDASPGVDVYRAAVQDETGSMTIPGTGLRGRTEDVFRPPRMRIWHPPSAVPKAGDGVDRVDRRDVDDVVIDEGGEPVRVEDLAAGPADRVVVIGGAGSGKSALLSALAHRMSQSAWVPAVVRLVELADSGRAVTAYLQARINERYAVSVDWNALCDGGVALLLFDGLDELPQHLRSKTLDEIGAFSARFPQTPWIMTVRDMAGTAAPVDARIVELQSLSPDDIEGFCRGWLPSGRAGLATEIVRKVSVSRELRRMARIPFLLALMIDHAPVPARRSELLEQYLGVLLRPEKHKPAIVGVDAITLRAGAEALAFAALDAGDTDMPARAAAAVVGRDAQGILDALVGRGLLRESRDRYAFVFPILQEYLAGHYLAVARHEEIVGRFESEVSRPWTQALQFAVEVSDRAEAIVTELLASPDDAFRTKLKILGRCVANGARVSPTTRARIGDELAARWIAEDREGTWTGELLADGFAKALPTAARERLRAREQLDFGGAAMIVAADDPELTESVLRASLGVGIPGHVYAWQSAIDRIAPTAARLYLERATYAKTAHPERKIHWLAYLLGRVADVARDDDPRVAFARDETADPLLRLACLLRIGSPLTEGAEPLVVESLCRYVAQESDGRSPAFDVVFDAMFRLPRAIEVWRACMRLLETTPLYAKPRDWWLFGLAPAEAYWRTVVFAIVPRMSADDATKHVRDLATSNDLSQTRKDYLDLVLAFLKDEDAFERLSNRLDAMHWRDVTRWIFLASSRPAPVVAAALPRLRYVSAAHHIEISTSLGFALSYEVELDGLSGGGRGKARRRHLAADEAVTLLRAWADVARPGSRERFACIAQAVNLGALEIAPALLREITERMDRPLDSDTDHRMSDALTAVADAGVAVPAELLVRAARISKHNLGMRAYGQLERLRSSVALDHLLALHAAAGGHLERILAGHIERLARALAVRIVKDPSGRLCRS